MEEKNLKEYPETYEEFQKEVGNRIKNYHLLKFSIKLCKELYDEGYSVKDAAGLMILNAE